MDKEYLVKMFGKQSILGYYKSKEEKNERKNNLLFPSPSKYFQDISNVIDVKSLKKIKKCFKIINKKYKNTNIFHKNLDKIKILKTFSFGIYIFIGFIVTFLYSNEIIIFLLSLVIGIYKRLVV